jgi:glycosyltransferase involved in cell wall biosynthesis
MAGVVCVSAGQKKKLASFGIKLPKTWVVQNAVTVHSSVGIGHDEERKKFFSELGLSNDSKLIVTAGRLSPEKGHKHLIEAIKLMAEKQNNACYVFCGEGQCREELEQQAMKLGVINMCRFLGFRRDLQRIFKVMDLMVLPSLTEGLPNVVLEAFSWAKPVVATKVGGVPEIIHHGENGFLVPPKRPDLLADSIQQCLNFPDLMNAMGLKGYDTVKAEFNFETQTQKLEQIYSEVMKSRPA